MKSPITNFEKYENKMQYPKPIPDLVLPTSVALQEEYKKRKEIYEIERKAYNQKDIDLDAEFEKDTLENLELTNHPKAKLLMRMAYENGKQEGKEGIYNHACYYAQLLDNESY